MFQVSSELYDEIAIRLREAFGGGGFYSGSVECAVGGDLVQVDGVARSLPQRRPLARRVSPTAYGRGSRVVGIPHRDSRRGGAQRFFRSPNCGPACSCSLIGEGRCSLLRERRLPTFAFGAVFSSGPPVQGCARPDETGSCADRPSGPSSRRSAAGSFDIRSRLPDFYSVRSRMALVRSGGFDVSSGKVGDAGGGMFSF